MFVDSHRSASRPASPDRRDCFALRSHGGARTAPGRVRHAVQAQALVSALALALMLLFAAEQVRAQPVAAAADIQTVVRTGDIESLRQAVAAGADLNARDHWGRTPLLVASQLKDTAAVRLLLARGADVDLANKNDITPLIAAAQTGNLEAMSLLLGAGAARDRSDNLGWTALMWAANRNDGAAVKLLVDKGADVGAVGRDGATALALARKRAADPAVLALLAGGSSGAGAAAGPRAAAPPPAPPRAAAAAAPLRLPGVDASRIVRGRADAPITIVEYTDFQCPYCAAGAKTVDEILARYEGQVRLVVKHLPLQFHPLAGPAAEYFEALSLQSPARAWAYYDRLFANPGALAGGEPYLGRLAGELGADLPRLEQDRAGAVVRARLASDLQEAQRFRFDGVPAFIVNGRVIEGAQPAQVFVDVIESILRQ